VLDGFIDNFNYARYRSQSIDSALAQSYGRVEVIVVDDVSTDRSRIVMAGYGVFRAAMICR
jgi:glycosyltransferase involved in cell wall biosynthesis